MTQKIFGTDGIRGTANSYPMTAEIAVKVGMAAGLHFISGAHRHRVVIGKEAHILTLLGASTMLRCMFGTCVQG